MATFEERKAAYDAKQANMRERVAAMPQQSMAGGLGKQTAKMRANLGLGQQPLDVGTPAKPGRPVKVPGYKGAFGVSGIPLRPVENPAITAYNRFMKGSLSKPTLPLTRQNPNVDAAEFIEKNPAFGVIDNFDVPNGARILGGGTTRRDVPDAPAQSLRGFVNGQDTVMSALDAGTRARAGLLRYGTGEGVPEDLRGRFMGRLGDAEVNPNTGRNALEEFALANQIRQETIDMLKPRRQFVVLGDSDATPSAENMALEAAATLRRPFNNQEKNDAYRAGNLLESVMRTQAGQENAAMAADATLGAAQIRAAQAAEEFNATAASNAAIQTAQRKKLISDALANVQGPQYEIAKSLLDSGNTLGAVNYLVRQGLMTEEAGQALLASADPTAALPPMQSLADGGLVEPTLQRTMGTGAIGSFGSPQPDMEAIQRYQQYSAKASEMNLPVMGFEQFKSMSTPDVKGYAEGGMVEASGRQVIDPDPAAPTDSIPAVIDGTTPAALDSGEFVIPKDVVMYYGTDKLTKMIEKARKPDGNNGAQSSAISQFGGAGSNPAV